MSTHNRLLIVLLAMLLLPLWLACGGSTPTVAPTETPAPTATATLRPTATPQPKATEAPPKATPTEESSEGELPEGLVILSHSSSADEDGVITIVGEVLNNTESNYEYVTIEATLYDKNQEKLDDETTYLYADILGPGGKCPFSLTLWEPPAGLDNYELEVDGDESDEEPFTGVVFKEYLEVESDSDTWVLIGEVTNESEDIGAYVSVAATLYDEDDNVVNVGYTSVERHVMYPDSLSPFEVYIYPISADAVRYELAIFGSYAGDYVLDSAAELEILTMDYIVDEFDDLIIVGEVKNNDPDNVAYARVFASFYDNDDNLVDVGWSYVWKDIIEPGEESPFRIDLFGNDEAIDHWTVWVEGDKTDDAPVGPLDLTNTDNESNDDDTVTFTGTVTNKGTVVMGYLEVAVTLYDAEGKVLMTDWTYLDGTLAPDESMDFEFSTTLPEGSTDYTLYVQGSEE